MLFQKGTVGSPHWRLGLAVLTCLITIMPPAQGAEGPQFSATRVWPSTLYTRLTFESATLPSYRYFMLESPRRLVIDIDDFKLSRVLHKLSQQVNASDPFISRIRVAKFDAKTLRVVVDLKQPVRTDIFNLKPVANFQHRLVVDLYPKLNSDKDPLSLFSTNTPSGRSPLEPLASPIGKASFIVMIDPGHGGEDPGAHGLRKTLEKNVVLQIAQRLKRLIDQQPDMAAVMTRSDDHFVPLAMRVAKAQQLKATIFVSIHADAVANRQARGASVFTLSTRGATSAAARFLANSQNESDLIGGVSRSGDSYLDSTLLELMQHQTLHDSAILGSAVLKQLHKINPLHKSRVERAGFAVLKAPNIPSILVETAFISHPEEERKLKTARYQQQVAEAILAGIQRYKAKRYE
ncbi:N-acetylmuramoyl-L-alanine amidase [Rosenbergiella nectarea]|uniref:N-acetylmuramoyl-L-alanine amidase n=1 Tax=Rosenbergiella nectarea TaxID=988801 RepID=UPI001BDAD1CB|nr:N-acetylmuramoyl-L-alanine amidase [Rosenbergiella nectarea]MBT0729857.1 AMIN domain-containing protein [Rosenbergiella nectarea subsp. apis]